MTRSDGVDIAGDARGGVDDDVVEVGGDFVSASPMSSTVRS